MKRFSSLYIILALLLSQFAAVFAQQGKAQRGASPQQQGTSQQQQQGNDPYEDEVVRISTNLVQVDAVVTDGNGRYVTDLKPEDFEISEDGERQKITNFSYITIEPGAAQLAQATASRAEKSTTAIPPVRLKPEQVRRTIALVVDDLCLSTESTGGVRKALRKYVNEQMQAGDLVAVIRTGGGVGTLQQFTADKRVLYAAIDRIRFFPGGRCGSQPIEPITAIENMEKGLTADNPGPVNSSGQSSSDSRASSGADATGSTPKDVNRTRSDIFTIGTLGTMNYVINGLRELPGRKAVVLFSDGIRIIDKDAIFNGKGNSDYSEAIRDALRRLVDLSNRSSVVVYTMDARGIQALGIPASDDFKERAGPATMASLSARSAQMFETQDGLSYLAKETGGFFIHDLNDLSQGMRRVVEDQKGYYLIGYRPNESTFDPKTGQRRFHKLSVKVKRSGLSVRSRTGFFGVAEPEMVARTRTPAQQIMAALTSPFNATGVDLRMTSLFGNDPARGSFMRSLVYVNARDLKFAEEAGGWRKATINLAAVTFDGEGRPVDQITETREVRVNTEGYSRIMQSGLTYALDIPVKQPGAYQLRVAVRDTASQKTGSASQFVSVPDLKKSALAMSGIVIVGFDSSTNAASSDMQLNSTVQVKSDEPDPQFGAAVRRLKQGMVLGYSYVIYNAQVDKSTNKPQLTTQVKIFRDGQLIFTGRESPLDTNQQRDLTRLVGGGQLQVGKDMIPGDYVLQVTVTDALAKEKQRTVTQWTDFEVIN